MLTYAKGSKGQGFCTLTLTIFSAAFCQGVQESHRMSIRSSHRTPFPLRPSSSKYSPATAKMHYKQHETKIASGMITSNIILLALFIFIAITIANHFIPNWFPNWFPNWLITRSMQQLHEHTMHGDLEARQIVCGEEIYNDYNTCSSSSFGADTQDLEGRRRQRRERMRYQISEVRQIAVSRLDDEDSVSIDDSESTCGIGNPSQRQGLVQREEESGDSSESDVDGNSDDIIEMRGDLSTVSPLPRQVAVLRTTVRRLVD